MRSIRTFSRVDEIRFGSSTVSPVECILDSIIAWICCRCSVAVWKSCSAFRGSGRLRRHIGRLQAAGEIYAIVAI